MASRVELSASVNIVSDMLKLFFYDLLTSFSPCHVSLPPECEAEKLLFLFTNVNKEKKMKIYFEINWNRRTLHFNVLKFSWGNIFEHSKLQRGYSKSLAALSHSIFRMNFSFWFWFLRFIHFDSFCMSIFHTKGSAHKHTVIYLSLKICFI